MSRTWSKTFAAAAFALGLTNFASAGTLEPQQPVVVEPVAAVEMPEKPWNDGFYVGALTGISNTVGHVRSDASATQFFNETNGTQDILIGQPHRETHVSHFGTTGTTYSAVVGWGTSVGQWMDGMDKMYLGLEGTIGGDSGNDTINQFYNYNHVDSSDAYRINYKKGLVWSVATRLGYKVTPTSMVYTRFGVKGTKEKLTFLNLNTRKNATANYQFGISNNKPYTNKKHNVEFTTGLGAEMLLTRLNDNADLNLGLQYDFTLGRKNKYATAAKLEDTVNSVYNGRAGKGYAVSKGNFIKRLNTHTFQVRLTAVMGSFDM